MFCTLLIETEIYFNHIMSTIQNTLHVNNRTFRVVVTRYSEDEYLAEIPSLTHCISSGGSIEEAITNITEVLEATLEVMQPEEV